MKIMNNDKCCMLTNGKDFQWIFLFLRHQPIEEEPETKMEGEKEKVPDEGGETSTYVNGTHSEATSSTSENQERKDIPKSELTSDQFLQNDGKADETESSNALPSPNSVTKDKRSSGYVNVILL